jgi:hypothetical protein
MDWQTAFNIAILIAGALGGWVIGRITKTLDQLDSDIRMMPEKYVTKVDHKEALNEIKAILLRMETKLDGKQDKGGR